MTSIVKRTEEQPRDFVSIVQAAIDKGIDADSMGKLLDTYERYNALQAKAAFDAAMAEFKAICPPVQRRTENSQFKVTRNGVQVPRKYAALEDIEATIREPLGRCGLSFRWSGAKVEGNQLTMTCIVSHAGGHSEPSPVCLPVESRAGCSEQQKYGAAMTYAQRYSLIQALGLTSCDEDQDGNDETTPETITENQAANLDALIADAGADKGRFLTYFKAERLGDIPAARFSEAVKMLEAKRGAKR